MTPAETREGVVALLYLALTAETDARAELCAQLASLLATDLTLDEAESCKQAAEKRAEEDEE